MLFKCISLHGIIPDHVLTKIGIQIYCELDVSLQPSCPHGKHDIQIYIVVMERCASCYF